MAELSQTTLLRIAAFLVDALLIALMLILPATIISYGMTWTATPKGIHLVWWAALGILIFALLIRDGIRGRSIGKHLLGLRLVTGSGKPCGYFRSVIRNLPLIVPLWNVVELVMVVFGRSRTGDRIARTLVTEE
ncbi:MAG TPA: RDD family protein [Thermoanaerobaculia bacterium]|jgi:uncharacterized RDD family membrane protein YckC